VKSSKPGRLLERAYIEAFVVGLCIGLAALLIDRWVGDAGWPTRIATLTAVGGLLCLVQFGITRLWRK
jgi:hypothetical protein